MERGLVTVVLPIYNVEKYLNRCIESVVNQTYRNLEILLIDDGSPDNCPRICDEWALKDERIRVIHKENGGLGNARNTGIENATGEYICFFDSDDYIALDTIEKIYGLAQIKEAQIVVFGFNTVNSKGEIIAHFVPGVGDRVYIGDDVLNEFLPDFTAPDHKLKRPRPFYMSAWLLLYSTDLIKKSGWKFVSERSIISEDVYSLLALFKYVNTVAVLPESLYFYCENDTSLSRSYMPGRYKKIKHFYDECLKLCYECGYNENVLHRVSKPYVAFTISALKQERAVKRSKKETLECIKEIIDDDLFQKVLMQNKRDIVSITRRILFFAARNKMYNLCYFLLDLRN